MNMKVFFLQPICIPQFVSVLNRNLAYVQNNRTQSAKYQDIRRHVFLHIVWAQEVVNMTNQLCNKKILLCFVNVILYITF